MRRALLLGLVLLAALGCETYTIAVPYSPAGIVAIPDLEPVAVYLFTDKRDEEEATRIGGIYGGYRNLIHKIYGTESAVTTVSRAIARGLEARGFRVLDLTNGPYRPRIDRPEARVAITGDVVEFWTESQWRFKALSAVKVVLYDVAIGEPRWTQTYRAEESTWETSGKNLQDFLAGQLTQMVQRLAVDPDLVAQVRAAGTTPAVPAVVTVPSPAPAPVGPSPRTADRLQELDGLKARGLITEDEYQATRKRILEGL